MFRILAFICFFGLIFGFGVNYSPSSEMPSSLHLNGPTNVPVNFKVAFIGDQGTGKNPQNVLNLVKTWGAEIIIHSGDFDYQNSPKTFLDLIESEMGADYPYFASVGNHDTTSWSGYQAGLKERLARIKDATCTGDYGVNMVCNYKGFVFVLSGVGTLGKDHVTFANNSLIANPSIWKACSWHKNQHLYQTGDKTDETGYPIYDICREHGAIIATGHEHSYSRTYLMSNFAKQTIAPEKANIVIQPGKTFAFVSGLAGVGIRPWKSNLEKNPWWASCASSSNGVDYGALLCTLNNGKANQGECFFQDVKGTVWDRFTVVSQNSAFESGDFSGSCHTPFFEYQVNSINDQFNSMANQTKDFMYLSHPKFVESSFTFHNLNLEIKQQSDVHFQVSGAEDGHGATSIQLYVELSGLGSSKPITWDKHDGDIEPWEHNSHWTSPNLASLIEQVMSNAKVHSFTGDVTLHLLGSGSERKIHSFHNSEILAPALIVQKLSSC